MSSRRRYDPKCGLPCCWPRPKKVRVHKDRELGIWRWEIPCPGRRPVAHGSAFDHAAALTNGLRVLSHLVDGNA